MEYRELVNKINDSPFKGYFAITGGGQTFIGDYLSIGGASKFFVGANVPYSMEQFDKFVGAKQLSYCSAEAARKLAVRAYLEAKAETTVKMPVGFGMTCSLSKDGPERPGRLHHIHVATHSYDFTAYRSYTLHQGRPRIYEESFAKEIMLNLVTYRVLGIANNPYMTLDFDKGERFEFDNVNRPATMVLPKLGTFSFEPIVLFPGSWNPFHEGHQEMVDIATSELGVKPIFELTISNADKGVIDYVEVHNRTLTIPHKYDFVLTEEPTFKGKVEALRKTLIRPIIFIVGADTWERIWDPKYAGPLDELEKFFKKNDVKFLVFGRPTFKTGVGVGNSVKIVSPRAEALQRHISSTEIRNQNYAKSKEASV